MSKHLKPAVKASLLTLVTLFALTIYQGAANAGTFPSKTVTLIVPYSAGGPIDVVARNMATKLSAHWKQPVIVMNRPGGNEVIAAQAVSVAPPDGYTILVSTEAALTVNPLIYKKLSYDADKDLAPVTRLANFAMALVVPSKMPVKNLKEFVELAKKTKSGLTFGTSGQGNPVHFAYIDLAQVTGINMIVVPYLGTAPIIPEMIGGRVDSTIGALSALQPHIAAGSLKALAIGGTRRSKLVPDVPTFAEQGLASVDATFFTALTVPSKTPSAVVDQIAKDVREVISDPEFVAKNFEPYALDLVADDPRTFKEFLVVNRKQQQNRVKISGYQAN